jgi:hypothetical protein
VVSYAALTVALLALVMSVAGVAEATGHKIGKNLVVTKSIKNGAVTGKKVKDRSLTAADLAPGTIPAPGTGKAIELAACNCVQAGPGKVSLLSPIGYSEYPSANLFTLPIDAQIADVHASVPLQVAGESVTFSVLALPPGASAFLETTLCTVGSGTNSCVGSGTISLVAGTLFYLQVKNGPAGAAGTTADVGYTLHAV